MHAVQLQASKPVRMRLQHLKELLDALQDAKGQQQVRGCRVSTILEGRASGIGGTFVPYECHNQHVRFITHVSDTE